jgi:CheY-like chemotaxis protein
VQEAEVQQSLRILVVDDQDIICELIAEYLTADGHEAITASCGSDALELFGKQHFDLVITDQSMPDLNGTQLAASIKSSSPATPVILLTGFGDEMQAQGKLPEAVDLILSKPVNMAGLRHAVFTALAASGAEATVPAAEVHAVAA